MNLMLEYYFVVALQKIKKPLDMFKTMIKTATVCLGIAMLATACKKDETPAKTYYLTALADSSGTDHATFE
mgnify:CR=1 FL=1